MRSSQGMRRCFLSRGGGDQADRVARRTGDLADLAAYPARWHVASESRHRRLFEHDSANMRSSGRAGSFGTGHVILMASQSGCSN